MWASSDQTSPDAKAERLSDIILKDVQSKQTLYTQCWVPVLLYRSQAWQRKARQTASTKHMHTFTQLHCSNTEGLKDVANEHVHTQPGSSYTLLCLLPASYLDSVLMPDHVLSYIKVST